MISIKQRYQRIIEYFEKNLPFAESELTFSSPYQLFVAVILSAQCTDKRVNLITPNFFKNINNFKTLATSNTEDVFNLIKSCSYPNNKTSHLIKGARYIVENYNCKIPASFDEIIKIPGVGRKTANVLLSVLYKSPVMAVDTHVFRISKRIGLVENAKTPYDVEKQLEKNIQSDKIPLAHHWLLLHGRYVCKARKPLCEECGISQFCLYFEKNNKNE